MHLLKMSYFQFCFVSAYSEISYVVTRKDITQFKLSFSFDIDKIMYKKFVYLSPTPDNSSNWNMVIVFFFFEHFAHHCVIFSFPPFMGIFNHACHFWKKFVVKNSFTMHLRDLCSWNLSANHFLQRLCQEYIFYLKAPNHGFIS